MTAHPPLFAFFGTSSLSVRVLEALKAHGFLPALVVTAPDKPQGRGLESVPSPVAQWAAAHEIEIIKPAALKDEALVAELGNTEWDVFVVAMYAKLIPPALLDMPKRGCLNVHPSLLPKFRGPSPILSAILADERETGVSVMRLTETMDAGPVVAQASIELEEDEWPPRGSVFEELLATEGGNLLAEVLPDWLAGTLEAQPQDDTLATFTKKFSDADARVEFDPACPPTGAEARAALLKIRTFDKSPRAHFFLTDPEKPDARPMRVIITDAAIENDTLKLLTIIPEGKREMPYEDFIRSRK